MWSSIPSPKPMGQPCPRVPKKAGFTIVENENKGLVQTWLPTKNRVCIDYWKLNTATCKNHFFLPFINQMLERLAGHEYYCFLNGYSGYNQISIALKDQEKTTFTCQFETFTYRHMPFGLCNTPATFQQCLLCLFFDTVEWFLEVFMDDFSIYGDTFDQCLHHLEMVLLICKEKNLTLNWEKCHFMVWEGIILGHEISRRGNEVDKVKIEVIAKLPVPKCIRDIRSFLGHAGFY